MPLDAFRGLAALWVALFHLWQWPRPALDDLGRWLPFITRGDKAVPIFVVLSGFLIYRSVQRIQTTNDLGKYALRRVLRIFPLYIATSFACLALIAPNTPFPFWHRVVAELAMLHSIGYPGFFNPPAWSLYIEVPFYVLCPLYVALFRSRRIGISLLVIGILVLSEPGGTRELALWKYFFVGIAASELVDRWHDVRETFAVAVVLAGSALLAVDISGYDWAAQTLNALFSVIGVNSAVGVTRPIYTIGLGVATLLLILGSVKSSTVARVLTVKPLLMLGAVSYSLFLWHGLVVAWTFSLAFNGRGFPIPSVVPEDTSWHVAAIAISSMLAISALSFVLIEKQFLALRPKALDSNATNRTQK